VKILLDTSVWIEYFKGGEHSSKIDRLLEMNVVATCGVVLSELLPVLQHKKQNTLVALLRKIHYLKYDVDWEVLIKNQTSCLAQGINKVGVPDLMISETVNQNNALLCSLDKHFYLMKKSLHFELYEL